MSLPPIYVGARARWLAALVACGIVQAASAVVAAVAIQRTLDAALAHGGASHAWIFVAVMLAAGVVGGTARWLERHLAERLGQDYVSDLRIRMFATLAHRNATSGQSATRGAVQLRFITDLSALSNWISLGQARLIVSSLLLAGTLGYMASLSPVMAAVVAGILGANAAASVVLGQRLEAAVVESRRKRGKLASLTTEKLASLPAIIGFGRLAAETERLELSSLRLRDAMNQRAFWIGSLRAVNEVAVRLAIAGVVAYGFVQVQRGEVTSGALLAAVSLVALMVTPVRDLGRVYELWKAGKVARRKIAEWIDPDLPEGTGRTRQIRQMRGQLEVTQLRLRPEQAQPIDCAVPPGEKVLVCGANGAGKTTLLWTLAGIRRGASGTVRIDGQPVHRLMRRSLQASIGIASPELPLLKGSVRRNLRYRAPRSEDEELIAACQRVGLDQLAPLPELLDLAIQEGGANLSDGERARLQLARAIVATPNILLLDEMEAHLDAAGRSMLHDVIRAYPGTVIFASHDPEATTLAGQRWSVTHDGLHVEPVGSPRVIALTGRGRGRR